MESGNLSGNESGNQKWEKKINRTLYKITIEHILYYHLQNLKVIQGRGWAKQDVTWNSRSYMCVRDGL